MSEEKYDFAAMQREMLEEAMGIKRFQTIDGVPLMYKQIEHRDFTVADILPALLPLLSLRRSQAAHVLFMRIL